MDTFNVELAKEKWIELDYSTSISVIRAFFSENTFPNHALIIQLEKQLDRQIHRYNSIEKHFKQGFISYEDYSIGLTRITDAVLDIFDSLSTEIESQQKSPKGSQDLDYLQGQIILSEVFNAHSKERAMEILLILHKIFSLKPDQLESIFINSGSIIIGIKLVKDYDLLIKMKSLVKIGLIENLVSINVQLQKFNKTCDLIANSNLFFDEVLFENFHFSERDFVYTSFQGAKFNSLIVQGGNFRFCDFSLSYSLTAVLDDSDLSWADLSNILMSKASLKRVKLFQANLSQAELYKADLSEANLTQCNLVQTKLFMANLSGAVIRGSDLSSSLLRGVQMENADLTNSIITGADLTGANLTNTNLTNVDLKNIHFIGVNLSGVDLSNRDLSNVNFTGADLRNTNLSNSNLDGTILSRTNWKNHNLSGKDFSGKDMSFADFSGGNLSSVNFSSCNLKGANLSDCELNRANFENANLAGSNFAFSDLFGVDLSKANLNNAKFVSDQRDTLMKMGINVESLVFIDLGGDFVKEFVSIS